MYHDETNWFPEYLSQVFFWGFSFICNIFSDLLVSELWERMDVFLDYPDILIENITILSLIMLLLPPSRHVPKGDLPKKSWKFWK